MTLTQIDEHRIQVTKTLKQATRSQLGQFFTPSQIASFMSSLFTSFTGDIKLLDPGAGIGSLTTAFLHQIISSQDSPASVTTTAYEVDPNLIPHLTSNIGAVGALLAGLTDNPEIIHKDFILHIAENRQANIYTHAILNPPYKKIATDSKHRLALRELGIETVNLYSGFLGVTIRLMQRGGEIVAIIPRSFCNGTYFLPFREYLLANTAIKQIHLFDSRSEPFNDDEVLQENVIIHLIKGEGQGDVIISRSTDATFSDLRQFTTPFDRIVKQDDKHKYLHIPEEDPHEFELLQGVDYTLKDLGITVSTGPVVDFRLKDHLKQNPGEDTVPLLYSHHFGPTEISWPKKDAKKPNAIVYNEESAKWLVPNGYYTITKRFSSKEENQRIVARVLNPQGNLPGVDLVGIENHLNYFHLNKQPLDRLIAYGLAAYLNAAVVDNHFRIFSGHTQVNATDLKQMKYPSLGVLQQLGEWAILQNNFVPNEIDQQLAHLCQSHNS